MLYSAHRNAARDDEDNEIGEAKENIAIGGDGEIREDCPNDNEEPDTAQVEDETRSVR